MVRIKNKGRQRLLAEKIITEKDAVFLTRFFTKNALAVITRGEFEAISRIIEANSKLQIMATDMLNDQVIPFFMANDVNLLRILTDTGTEYCGKVENHPYQLYLAMEDVDHSKTKANSPQTNGICERFHKTMKNEFYDIAFRKKLYQSPEELQTDIDHWLSNTMSKDRIRENTAMAKRQCRHSGKLDI